MVKKIVLLFGTFYGLFAVILGAFGAHALKNIFDSEALKSFETGVKYQMYHAIVLLLIGFFFSFNNKAENLMGWFFVIGVFLFSVSIYLLSFNYIWQINFRFIGPVTPLGGLLLILGWIMLIYNVVKRF